MAEISHYDLEAARYELQESINCLQRDLSEAIERIETMIARTDQEIIRIGERLHEVETEVFPT